MVAAAVTHSSMPSRKPFGGSLGGHFSLNPKCDASPGIMKLLG